MRPNYIQFLALVFIIEVSCILANWDKIEEIFDTVTDGSLDEAMGIDLEEDTAQVDNVSNTEDPYGFQPGNVNPFESASSNNFGFGNSASPPTGARGLTDKEQKKKYKFIKKINNSRCWCRLDSGHILKGRSKPLDALDQACKELVHGYRCIKMELESKLQECEPGKASYDIDVTTVTLFFNSARAFEQCENLEDECSRKSCMVELQFVRNAVGAIQSGIDVNAYNHDDPAFNFNESCPKWEKAKIVRQMNFQGEHLDCCGEYPNRRIFKTNYGQNKCCGNRVYDKTINQCCDAPSSYVNYICI